MHRYYVDVRVFLDICTIGMKTLRNMLMLNKFTKWSVYTSFTPPVIFALKVWLMRRLCLLYPWLLSLILSGAITTLLSWAVCDVVCHGLFVMLFVTGCLWCCLSLSLLYSFNYFNACSAISNYIENSPSCGHDSIEVSVVLYSVFVKTKC